MCLSQILSFMMFGHQNISGASFKKINLLPKRATWEISHFSLAGNVNTSHWLVSSTWIYPSQTYFQMANWLSSDYVLQSCHVMSLSFDLKHVFLSISLTSQLTSHISWLMSHISWLTSHISLFWFGIVELVTRLHELRKRLHISCVI